MSAITKESFAGMSILPLTPLNDDYTVNKKAIGEVMEMMIGFGMTSVWTRGYCAEGLKLTVQQSKDMLEGYLDAGKGKTIMGAGISAMRPTEVVELGQFAENLGYDFLWVTPSPLAKSDREILAMFKYIIDNTKIPLALYNSSGTGVYLSPILLRDIIDLAPERFVAAKDSQGSVSHISQMFRIGINEKVSFLTTADSHLYTLTLGSRGIMGTPEHAVLGKALYDAFVKGDMEKAKFYQYRLEGGFPYMGAGADAVKTQGVTPMPIQMADQKYAMSVLTGIDHGPYVPPTLHAPQPVLDSIKKYIEWWKPYDVDAPLPDVEICDILGIH